MSETAHTLSGAGFDAIYRDQIEPELHKRDADRKKGVRTYGLILAASVVAAIVFALIASKAGWAGGVVFGGPIFIVILAAIFGSFPLSKVAKSAKQATIETL